MPRGLPASYIKQAQRELGPGASWSKVFKRAWQIYKGSNLYKKVYKGGKTKSRSRSKTRRKRSMPRKRSSRRRRRKSISIATVGGLIGSLLTPNTYHPHGTWHYIQTGEYDHALANVVENFTGYDFKSNRWSWQSLLKGLTPVIAGVLASKVAGWLGINRRLGRMPSPINKIKI